MKISKKHLNESGSALTNSLHKHLCIKSLKFSLQTHKAHKTQLNTKPIKPQVHSKKLNLVSGCRPERWGGGGANGDIAGGRSGLEVWWFCEKKMRERERGKSLCVHCGFGWKVEIS